MNKPANGRGPWGAPEPDPRQSEAWNFASRITSGVVETANKDGITLFRPEVEILHWRHEPKSGEPFGVVKREVFPSVAAKKFLLVDELAKGRYLNTGVPQATYRIADLEPGDWVTVEYCRRNGVDICSTICVDRRPGGRVPPTPGENPDAFRKHHEAANANQDCEERRLPFPRNYWPTSLGANGLFYAAPYPGESIQIIIRTRLPTAPAPREVKPPH